MRARAFSCSRMNAGGENRNPEVVVDGNLVTSRTTLDMTAWYLETLRILES